MDIASLTKPLLAIDNYCQEKQEAARMSILLNCCWLIVAHNLSPCDSLLLVLTTLSIVAVSLCTNMA
jgi:hypothetical protein